MGAQDDTSQGAESERQAIEPESCAEAQPQNDSARTRCEASDETLRSEYQEICKSHLAITDFRGKLLGLLPLAAGTGIFLLLDKTRPGAVLAAAGVFGTFVTIGLYFYEQRGMKECIVLRDRGGQLERKLRLGKENSQFQDNTPGFIGPQGAGPIVYFAVIAGWLFVISYAFAPSKPGWPRIAVLASLGLIIFVAYLIALRVAFLKFYYDKHSTAIKEAAKQKATENRWGTPTASWLRRHLFQRVTTGSECK